MRIDGKTAIVTGAASGIGRATAEMMAAAGARVFCADLNEVGGLATVEQVRCAGGEAEFLHLDVTDNGSVTAFAAAVLDQAPRVDILVNAAGGAKNQPFLASRPEDWASDTAINFLGPVKVTHAFLQHMVEAGGGKIVNVASDAGRVGSYGETVYAGAKGGVIAFTKSLAREVARSGINVNCVCPGPTDTPMARSRPQKMQEAWLKAIPFHRLAEPSEIGQVLSVSGGLTMAG
jgi:2-hydroxycyclohexanecarboxyl-CoA dehydrogenase